MSKINCSPVSNLPNKKTQGMLGDAFSEEMTYNTGEYCIYQNALYKFTSDKEPGAWDETKVEATTVDAEMSDMQTQINELTSGSQNMANMSASESYMVLSNKDSTASIAANYSDKKVYIQFPGGNQLTLSGV